VASPIPTSSRNGPLQLLLLRSGSTSTSTLIAPNPTLKVGLTSNIDFEVNISPFVHIDTDLATGLLDRATGPSDLFLRSKINLWGNGGWKSAFALIPFIKAPTAPQGIGTRL